MPNAKPVERTKEGLFKKCLILSLIVTRNCNLKCSYCYEKHDMRDNRIMELSVAKDAVTRYMNSGDEYDALEIEFFGGEPFLAFPLIKDVVEWFHEHEWPKKHFFLIGTNGTILTDDMKNWLLTRRECLNIALSIDGTKTAHNLNRDNSYDRVYKNLSFFKKYWPHQPAKMTIGSETIQYTAESIIELEEMGLNFTANIGFENVWGKPGEKKKLLKIYEEQLQLLVDYYTERPHLSPVAPIFKAAPDFLGFPDYGREFERKEKRYCGAGHEMVVVDVDGTTYPCHRFLPWVTGRAAPEKNANCQTAWKPIECANCKLILSCPTCAGYNWEINGDTGIRTTFHCDSYKLEVLASAKLEAINLSNQLTEINTVPNEIKEHLKRRLEAICNLIESGV